jgi:type I site-specific restriction endonuclease
LSPEFLTQLREDIDTQLAKHRAQEPRGDRLPQAMILVNSVKECKKLAQGLGSDATYIVADKESIKNLENFTKGDKRIGIVCGMLREGYDNSNVTLVVILRKCRSRVLFEQISGRCMRIRRDLTGKAVDKAVGTVMSYDHFEQGVMWDARLKMAEEDPIDDDEDTEIEVESGNEA